MLRFYLIIWLFWLTKSVVFTFTAACGFALLITVFIYVKLGLPPINGEIQNALIDIFQFWFPVTLSFSLLIALFLSLKSIFNRCIEGYSFKLLSCDAKEVIEKIRYQDTLKVFRKWLMLIIWLVGVQMVVAFAVMKFFIHFDSIFEWFDIYLLFVFIALAAYISFILLAGRCKRIKVSRC